MYLSAFDIYRIIQCNLWNYVLCSQTYAQTDDDDPFDWTKEIFNALTNGTRNKSHTRPSPFIKYFFFLFLRLLFISIGSVLIQQFVCNMITFTLFNSIIRSVIFSSLVFNVTYGVYFCTDVLCKKGYLRICEFVYPNNKSRPFLSFKNEELPTLYKNLDQFCSQSVSWYCFFAIFGRCVTKMSLFVAKWDRGNEIKLSTI